MEGENGRPMTPLDSPLPSGVDVNLTAGYCYLRGRSEASCVGSPMRVLQGKRTRPVTSVAVARDGRTLVAGGERGFEVHDLAAGTSTQVVIEQARRAFAIVLDPLGRWLYYSGSGHGFWVYDLGSIGRKWRLADSVGFGDNHAISVAASADGARLALARGFVSDHRLECRAVADDGSTSLVWRRPPASVGWGMFRALAFRPGGHGLGAIDDGPVLLDADDGARLSKLGSLPYSLGFRSSFTATGDEFAVLDERGLHLFATAEVRPPRTRRHVGAAIFRGVAFHPSGRFFVTVANDGAARYWDLASLTQTQAFNWKAGKLQSVAFSHDGTLAAAGTDKGDVVLWDVDC